MAKIYRQGDILFVKTQKLPGTGFTRKTVDKSGVVALGEVTGHSHRIASGGILYKRKDGAMAVSVTDKEAEVVHEEHNTVKLPKGKYSVVRQREHTPQGAQRVFD